MTDKVQKIKDWSSKEQDGLMDAQGNFEYPEHEGAYHILCNLDAYIDSLQEEPSIPEIVDEHYWEMLGEEPVSEFWHDASKEPNDMSHCLIFYGDKNDVGHYLHYEPVLYNHQEKVFVTESFPHPTGYKVEQKSIDGGCVAEAYKDRRDRISISDITQWCYLYDLHNLSNVERIGKEWKEEPVSEDLGEYINELSKQFPDVSFAKLSRIAVRVTKWQKGQFEKNRLKHCNNITNEQAELEQGFIDQHIDKYNRMPTFLDAIEYGMRLQKEQMMANAVETTFNVSLSSSLHDKLRIKGCKEGDKLLVIKEDRL